jgi:preprotein translocase subunit YajC
MPMTMSRPRPEPGRDVRRDAAASRALAWGVAAGLMLLPMAAQAAAPSGAAPAGAPGGGGAGGGAGQAPPPGGFGGGFLLLIMGMFIFLIVTQIFAGRKEKKRREEMLGSLGRHDRVQTSGGMIGTIVEVKDDEVLLKIDEASNTKARFATAGVRGVRPRGGGGGGGGAGSAQDRDEDDDDRGSGLLDREPEHEDDRESARL